MTEEGVRRWRNVLVVAVLLALALITCGRGRRVERATSSGDRDFVSAVVDVDVATARRVIQETFAVGQRPDSPARRHPHFRGLLAGDVPSPSVMNLGSEPNVALERYVKLEPSARPHDLQLWPASDNWWLSEYHSKGVPLPFSTYFIIHLEAKGERATSIEVIEYFPSVWTHNAFRLHRHGGGIGPITQRVGPTTRDRIDMLNFLIDVLDPSTAGVYVPALPPWYQLD